MERDAVGGFELAVVFVAGVAAVGVGTIWAGAVASLVLVGRPQGIHLGAAVAAATDLPATLSDPADVWPAPYRGLLPGPVAYWVSTAAVGAAILTAGALVLRWVSRSRVGTSRRDPLGVDARPRFARRRDLRTVLVQAPTPGRLVIAKFGRSLVATEAPPSGPPKATRAWHPRRGDRGAVALIGPSRSGKTTAAVAGILEWSGPAVLSSVKADLLGATHGWRARIGKARVYDPMASSIPLERSAMWSPLLQASTVGGAQRAARALCEAAPSNGLEGGDFWLAQAEILLSGLMFVARTVNRDMTAVCGWVFSQDRPTDAGDGDVHTALNELSRSNNHALAESAADVRTSLTAVWDLDERTRSSVYATAQTVVWPWSDPGVATSAGRKRQAGRGNGLTCTGGAIDLAWLLSGANTVYLCSPIEDQRRLAPAFGGLLNDLINQVYRHVASKGRPLDPPLLVVIDEAGNTPLRSLPEYASTLAGLGVLLVTVWQSVAQLQAAYGPQADTILTNHLTKVMYAGLSDPASLRYVDQILGQAEVDTRSHSAAERLNGGSDQYSTTHLPLAPAHVLRQMRPGDALLVHGTLPPAHVRTRPFYATRHLAERAAMPIAVGKGGRA